MKFIKTLLFVMTLAMSPIATAQVTGNTDGLTDGQKAELIKQAEAMRARSSPTSSVVDNVDQWLNIGERVGKMMGGAARELGLAANEFVKSPVGIMATVVILFQYLGSPIIHMFTGILVLLVGIASIRYIVYNRRGNKITYDTERKNLFGNYPVKHKELGKMDDDTFGWAIALYVATVSAATIVFLTF